MNRNGAWHQIWVICQIAQIWCQAPFWVAAAEMPTLAGPAMGTTYRVTLAADISGMSRGEVHREVEAVLARIDRAASTWRDDSDASRFNRAAAGEWVAVSKDLVTLVETAREIHEQSDGAFDVTVGPLVRLWAGGVPAADTDHGQPQEIFLADGMAVATSTCRPGRSPIDPRTGRPVASSSSASSSSGSSGRTATVRAANCATADAWAVAAVVLELEPERDGTITMPEQPRSVRVP